MAVLSKSFQSHLFQVVYQVEERSEGQRLDQFIKEYLPSFSREQIKKKIESGDVTIKGRTPPHRPSCKVHTQDQIILKMDRTTHEDEFWLGEKVQLDQNPPIIFEDSDLLVVSKPAYMATHPTGKHLFYAATVHFRERVGKSLHSLHRLDRETSGVLLLGKNSKVSSVITPLFEKGQIRKCYFFIGVLQASNQTLDKSEMTVKYRLGSAASGPERVIVKYFDEQSDQGKRAETDFVILENINGYILGLAYPKTGRQHQIRVHAQSLGFPLLGDKLYLGGYPLFQRFKDFIPTEEDHKLMELPRQALHAMALQFQYKNNDRIFTAPFPLDLILWMKNSLKLSSSDVRDLEERSLVKIEQYFSKCKTEAFIENDAEEYEIHPVD